MSVLHINHIKTQLKTIYETLIDMSDAGTDTTSVQYEDKFLTRALAAYSVQIICDAEPSDIAASITDGGDDNGIDCIFFNAKEHVLYLVQSKWIKSGDSEPESGDVKKFSDGIRDLVNLKFERFNKKTNDLRQKIEDAFNDPKTRYVTVLSYTGTNGPAKHSMQTVEDLLSEMNDASELMTFKCIKQQELYQSIANDLNKNPINVDLTLKNYGKYNSTPIAFYGVINGSIIADWWTKFGDKLFAKNLRGFLGKSDVNDEIQNTLSSEQENFWYYNNGITIIAESVDKTIVGGGNSDTGTFYCKNISVVNGAQTVSSIGKFANGNIDCVKDIYVTCRIIELKNAPDGFGELITKTNNRQNKIEYRDFVTLDPEQIRIRTEASIEGFTYSLLRSENYQKNEATFDLVDATNALACYSQNPSIFTQLKREIGKLWEDTSKAPYRILFNPQVTGNFVIKAVAIQTKVDKEILSLQKNKTINGKKLAVLIHGNRMIGSLVYSKLKIKELNKPTTSIDGWLNKIDSSLINNLVELVYNELQSSYANAIIPTFFKNVTKCKDVFDKISASFV